MARYRGVSDVRFDGNTTHVTVTMATTDVSTAVPAGVTSAYVCAVTDVAIYVRADSTTVNTGVVVNLTSGGVAIELVGVTNLNANSASVTPELLITWMKD